MRNMYPVKYYSDEGFVEHKMSLATRTWRRSSASIWNGMPMTREKWKRPQD